MSFVSVVVFTCKPIEAAIRDQGGSNIVRNRQCERHLDKVVRMMRKEGKSAARSPGWGWGEVDFSHKSRTTCT